MRHTLEQLKAMSSDEIWHMWRKSQFPFDSASCGLCLTSHDLGHCLFAEHKECRAQANALWNKMNDGSGFMGEIILKHIEEFYALRLFYDSLYPQQVEEKTAKQQAEESCEKS